MDDSHASGLDRCLPPAVYRPAGTRLFLAAEAVLWITAMVLLILLRPTLGGELVRADDSSERCSAAMRPETRGEQEVYAVDPDSQEARGHLVSLLSRLREEQGRGHARDGAPQDGGQSPEMAAEYSRCDGEVGTPRMPIATGPAGCRPALDTTAQAGQPVARSIADFAGDAGASQDASGSGTIPAAHIIPEPFRTSSFQMVVPTLGQPDRSNEGSDLGAVPIPAVEEIKTPTPCPLLDGSPISSVTANIRPSQGDMPKDCAREMFSREQGLPSYVMGGRGWVLACYQWDASGLYHRPLYFEETNLERHGYGPRHLRLFQPVLSAGHFFGTLPLLPYEMTLHPPRECMYTLGEYRPGSPVPYQVERLPLRPIPAAVSGGVAAGLIFLIP